MSSTTSLTEKKAFQLPRLAREDTVLIYSISIALAVWACIALLFATAFPDTSTDLVNNASAFSGYVTRNATFFLFGFVILSAFRFLQDSRGKDSATYIREAYSRNPARFLGIPVMLGLSLVSFAVFMLVYSTIKTRIPEILPFAWDQTFAAWDKAVFFGHDPWRLFEWVYDVPVIVRTVDFIYDFWALFLVGSWVVCFISREQSLQRRLQYCLALILTWFIGGNLLALLFSSAGPCYYHEVYAGSTYYADQMAHLNAIGDLRALDHQAMLWSAYSSSSLGLGGISAMPSMHCATAFLFILMFGQSGMWRILTVTLFVIIFLGSFILAWHYALDGVLAMLVAYACWRLAGYIARYILRDPAKA
ncbi:MAG: phosphatase PAP2 family protein [Pseudomonadota bacterium]